MPTKGTGWEVREVWGALPSWELLPTPLRLWGAGTTAPRNGAGSQALQLQLVIRGTQWGWQHSTKKSYCLLTLPLHPKEA